MLEFERIGFGDEGHGVANHGGMRAQRSAVWAEPVKDDRILAVQVIEQIPQASAHQLQRAFGQDAGFDDAPDRRVR